jgi:hypothetical protein
MELNQIDLSFESKTIVALMQGGRVATVVREV